MINLMSEQKRPEVQLSPEQLAREQLELFASNLGLAEMSRLFGLEELPKDTHERLASLQEVAVAHWDYRKGAERQEVNWDDELLDQEGSDQWNTIFEAGDKLGLVENSEPTNKHPNSLAILGGANRSPYDRLRYGLSVVDDFDQVVFLGSSRAISDTERDKVADYAPDAQTEFDLGCGAFETLLGATMTDEISIERDGDTWGMRLYEFERDGDKKTGFVLSTPQTIGEEKRRATTYDNYRFFADRAELAENPDHTVVAVTNAFYTAGQHLPAVQELTLPYGVQVESVGFSAEYGGTVRKPSQLLQETKSAIDAAVCLDDALTTA